jgi:hypothetical protein
MATYPGSATYQDQEWPPAICAGCANRELGELETQINLLAPWKRRIVWTSMVQRAAGKVATRRSA